MSSLFGVNSTRSDNASMDPQMSIDDYWMLFSHNVRAMLNWDLLRETNAFVETKVLIPFQELESLFTVWHIGSDGGFAD